MASPSVALVRSSDAAATRLTARAAMPLLLGERTGGCRSGRAFTSTRRAACVCVRHGRGWRLALSASGSLALPPNSSTEFFVTDKDAQPDVVYGPGTFTADENGNICLDVFDAPRGHRGRSMSWNRDRGSPTARCLPSRRAAPRRSPCRRPRRPRRRLATTEPTDHARRCAPRDHTTTPTTTPTTTAALRPRATPTTTPTTPATFDHGTGDHDDARPPRTPRRRDMPGSTTSPPTTGTDDDRPSRHRPPSRGR